LFTNSTVSGTWFDGTRVITPNTSHVVGATRGGGQRSLYLDGLLDVAGSDAGSLLYDTKGGVIGSRTDAGRPTEQYGGTILWIGWWNRALSPAEVAQLNADPYAMFPAPRLFVPTGGALKAQILTATQATAPTLRRGTAKRLAMSQAFTSTLTRGTTHILATAQSSLTTLTRATLKGVGVTQATSAIL